MQASKLIAVIATLLIALTALAALIFTPLGSDLLSLFVGTPAAQTAQPDKSKIAALQIADTAGVRTCAPLLGVVSSQIANGRHAATAFWNKDAADKHIFAVANAVASGDPAAPLLLSFASVTPLPSSGCDASSLVVQSYASSCEAIGAALEAKGAAKGELTSDVKMFSYREPGARSFLLPASASSCVVVTSQTWFGK